MKVYIFILLLLASLFQSCDWKSNSKQDTKQKNESSDSIQEHSIVTQDILFNDAAAIRMLEEFYRTYLTEMMKDDLSPLSRSNLENIKKQYVSESLLIKIKNEDLDHDPFIEAEDYRNDWIETLTVSKNDFGSSIYVVSFASEYDDRTKKIFLSVKKVNDTYLIDDLLPEPIPDLPPANIATNQDSESIINYGRYTCDDEHVVIDIENSESYKIFEKGKLLDSGKYTISHDGGIYINMNNFGAIYYNDTLLFQNAGNSMNHYHHFESVDKKYIYFTNNANQ